MTRTLVVTKTTNRSSRNLVRTNLLRQSTKTTGEANVICSLVLVLSPTSRRSSYTVQVVETVETGLTCCRETHVSDDVDSGGRCPVGEDNLTSCFFSTSHTHRLSVCPILQYWYRMTETIPMVIVFTDTEPLISGETDTQPLLQTTPDHTRKEDEKSG